MRPLRAVVVPGVVVATMLLALSSPVHTQEAALRARLGTLMTAAAETPDGRGLLAVALAEARTAAAQAGRGTLVPDDLAAMQAHAAAVLHALDPTLVAKGPGLGFGLRRAVSAIIPEVDSLATSTARADVTAATTPARAAARNVLQWTTAAIARAERIQAATSAEEAAVLVPDLLRLTRQLTRGVDTNGDGRVTDADTEAGLHALELQLGTLLVRYEGRRPQVSTVEGGR